MTHVSRAAIARAPFLLCILSNAAFAQSASQPAPTAQSEAAEAVSDIVVTGERPAVKSAIDRKIYRTSGDVTAANGSIADFLRNLPSVDVDVEGKVSLRGDANVQILVDGKPSAQFSGSNRAQALQQLAAGMAESVEVMPNPSAEYGPDGTAGIINIVMKKTAKPGQSGSVQLGASSTGGGYANGQLARRNGPFNLTTSFGARRESFRQFSGASITRVDPATSAHTDVREGGRQGYAVAIFNASAGLDYDATARDRLSVSGSIFANDGRARSIGSQLRTSENGQTLSAISTAANEPYTYALWQFSADWRHSFTTPGRSLSLSGRLSGSRESRTAQTDYVALTGSQSRGEERRTRAHQAGRTLLLNYVHPLANGGSLKTGYEFRADSSDADLVGRLQDAAGTRMAMPGVTNHFLFRQSNHQLFATWQQPLGKLTALAGLRLERAAIEYEQVSGNLSGSNAYFDIHPSAHLQYATNEDQKFTFSYSHRVSRPSAFQLNPFVRAVDEFNAIAGNPYLRPTESHSVEMNWERQEGRTTIGSSIFWRQAYNSIGEVDRFLRPGLVLHTYENQGGAASGGLELDVTGKFGSGISYHLNGNLAYNQLQRTSTAGGQKRGALAHIIKANVDYRPTSEDQLQVSGSYAGRQLTSQGYRLPVGGINLGYRRKLGSDMTLTATVSDIFGSRRRVHIADTPAIFGRSEVTGYGRVFMLGLTRQFGGRSTRDSQFDYVSGP